MTGSALPCLEIPRQLYERLLRHCQEALPEEACGVLVGRTGRVTCAVALRNASPAAAVAFAVDPVDEHSLRQLARRRGEEILAVYHSHPQGGAYPSRQDQHLSGARIDYSLIVSLQNRPPTVRAFRLLPDQVLVIPHRIRDADPGEWIDLR